MSVTLIRGDARSLPLADASVDLIVTSPPYFALRSYTDGGQHYAGQVGSEATPAEFIAALIACTREWMRVLKPSGSIWVNLGDKYANDAKWGGSTGGKHAPGLHGATGIGRTKMKTGIPAKSLMLLPERYRIAAVDDLCLIARAVLIWSKPNGLPESVTDRVRRSHEDWVHLTKQPRYFAAVDEIRETYAPKTAARYRAGYGTPAAAIVAGQTRNGVLRHDGGGPPGVNPLGKLPGSVWEVASQPLSVPKELGVDHFAAFPMEWPRRLILGWSPSGICVECGEGRRPLARRDPIDPQHLASNSRQNTHERLSSRGVSASSILRTGLQSGQSPATHITGYACDCAEPTAATRPAAVLDPFGGTGTTAMVAEALGRRGISVDMSADYSRLARWRCNDPAQRAAAMQVDKPEPVMDGQLGLFEGVL